MTKMRVELGRPSIWKALNLRCPYCSQSPLLQKGSWFTFEQGCQVCDYRYERENGYYTGASWMVNFPVTASLAFLLVVALVSLGGWSAMAMAAACSSFVMGFGLFFFPFSQAIWMVIEHSFKGLSDEDRLSK